MSRYFKWLIQKRDTYPPIDRVDYLRSFGIEKQGEEYVVTKREVLEKAYEKAWANRDFEIDKFWTRAAYFWGFIVIIFGGYVAAITSEHHDIAKATRLDLFLLLLGFLFSISWYLVIRGSKFWQKNWEAHIDQLEDFVSGPLYKTIFYSGSRSYSVSKLNEVMAIVVMIVWIGLLVQFFSTLTKDQIDFTVIIAVTVTLIFSVVLFFGYSAGTYKSEKDKFIGRWDI